MNTILHKLSLSLASLTLFAQSVMSETCTVSLSDVKQKIQGFGGINHPCWQGYDLTDNDIDKLFGVGDGKLGLSVMRIWVAESSNNWSRELQTCKKVQKMGVKIFATPWNTPESSMCTNTTSFCNDPNCKYRSKEKQINTSSFEKYTQHLISFNNYMYENGVSLYAMSYANEPDYGHDWTWWTADQVYDYAKNYAGRLRVNGTKVITAESFAYSKNLYNKILNDASALKNIDILGTHFYASGASTGDNFFQYDLANQKIVPDPNKEVWMTEYYTSSNATNGSPCRANVWPEALEVAYSIHRGMAISNMSAYVWWYLKRNYSLINNGDDHDKNSQDGQITKRGYLFGQYARFIRPGYYRVGATINPQYNVYCSAYKDNNDVVIVAVNMSTEAKTQEFSIPGTQVKEWDVYITDQTRNIAKITGASGTKFTYTLPAKSCVTFVGKGGNFGITVKADKTVIEEGDEVNISVDTLTQSNIRNITYFVNGDTLKDKWVAPYAFTCGSDWGIGEYEISAIGHNENGENAESVITIKVVKKRAPYNGIAQKIPGKIEAEFFDDGVEGIAYQDNDEKNQGDSDLRGNSVDIYDNTTGGLAVGYCQAGEWMKYTVEVEKDGEYKLYVSLSDEGDISKASIVIDGDETKTYEFESVDTKSWKTYEEIETEHIIPLTAGKHEITLNILTSWINIDYLKFVDTDKSGVSSITKIDFEPGLYDVVDMAGSVKCTLNIESHNALQTLKKSSALQSGVYVLKNKNNGKAIKIVVE